MKRSLYIAAAVLVGYLALPLLGFLFGDRSDVLENQAKAQVPDLSMASVMDGTYFRGLEAVVDEENPTRPEAVKADAWVDLEVFGDSPNPLVIVGDEPPWLYLTQAIAQPCEAKDLSAVDMASAVARLTEAMAASGIEVHLAVAPSKPTIYPEHLPVEWADDARCAADVSQRARQALASAEIVGYFDVFPAMAEAKEASDTELYFPNDSHWNNLGALVYFEQLLTNVSPELANRVELVHSTELHEGDLTDLIGLPSSIESARVDVKIPGSVVERNDTAVPGGPPIRHTMATNDQVALVGGKTVVIHDSYLNQMITWVGQSFDEVVFMHWEVYTEERFAAELASADRVIIEVVERGMFNRLGGQLGSDGLYNAFLEESQR